MSKETEFRLRGARPGDRGAVAGSLAWLPTLYPGGGQWFDRKFDEVLLGRQRAIVADVDGQVGGIALDSEKGTGRRKLSTIYVAPTWRGIGIGRALIAQLTEIWSAANVRHVSVTAPSHVLDTILFLQRNGFSVVATEDARYGEDRAETVLQWQAGPASLRP